MRLVSHSAQESRDLGRRLACLLQPGDVICLQGDLGAGKTTFVQGLAEGLETDQPATSPSFTLLHQHPGRLRLHHLDLYRLGPADLADIGVEELVGEDGVAVIEWAERLPPGLRQQGLEIAIEFDPNDENTRWFCFSARGHRGTALLDQLREACDARAGD
jgi:tRNA threonylcarbamoyladenosine biosynthesis protein TsaE